MKATSGTFKGFPAEGIAFLRKLKKNNDREWFMPRLESYKELVRAPMLELVCALHRRMLGFAPAYVGDPAKCIYRIYRDMRFSKDKTPYKTRTDALFWRNNLERSSGGGFYVSISPDEVGIGGGFYAGDPKSLLAVRQHIAANADEFRAMLEAKRVRRLLGEMRGEKTARVPKGFAADHAAPIC